MNLSKLKAVRGVYNNSVFTRAASDDFDPLLSLKGTGPLEAFIPIIEAAVSAQSDRLTDFRLIDIFNELRSAILSPPGMNSSESDAYILRLIVACGILFDASWPPKYVNTLVIGLQDQLTQEMNLVLEMNKIIGDIAAFKETIVAITPEMTELLAQLSGTDGVGAAASNKLVSVSDLFIDSGEYNFEALTKMLRTLFDRAGMLAELMSGSRVAMENIAKLGNPSCFEKSRTFIIKTLATAAQNVSQAAAVAACTAIKYVAGLPSSSLSEGVLSPSDIVDFLKAEIEIHKIAAGGDIDELMVTDLEAVQSQVREYFARLGNVLTIMSKLMETPSDEDLPLELMNDSHNFSEGHIALLKSGDISSIFSMDAISGQATAMGQISSAPVFDAVSETVINSSGFGLQSKRSQVAQSSNYASAQGALMKAVHLDALASQFEDGLDFIVSQGAEAGMSITALGFSGDFYQELKVILSGYGLSENDSSMLSEMVTDHIPFEANEANAQRSGSYAGMLLRNLKKTL